MGVRVKVRKTDLGQLEFLAEGGFGKVFQVRGYTLPGDQALLAYKEFTGAHAEQARSARAAVVFRDGLDPAGRTELDQYCAWPRAVVEDGWNRVCGLLMPLIPAEFFCRLADESGQLTSQPRQMGWLIASAMQRQAAQVDQRDIDHTGRMLLLAQLVYVIGRLHKHGWVYGDLSFKNAVFAEDPPRVMLLDCDGAAALADTARTQASTPYWDPPECPIRPAAGQPRQQDRQDTVTDVYKLGLAILRCLSPGKGAGTTRSASRLDHELDAEGISLVARALNADRATRPAARDLYAYLYKTASPRITAPEITVARLVTPVVPRGLDARIEWEISGATSATVQAGNNYHAQVDLAAHPQSYAFRADESGPVTLEVSNQFGIITADLGELTVYELPAFSVTCDHLPRPEVAAFEAFSLEPLAAVLDGRPDVRASIPRIPDLMPDGVAMAPMPRMGDAIIASSDLIRTQLLTETLDYAAARRRTGQGDGT
jgi:hypothetical protein